MTDMSSTDSRFPSEGMEVRSFTPPDSQIPAAILVVDDDAQAALALVRDLVKEGYAVQYVLSGEKALSAVVDWKPDLILLDIRMPDIDGLEVCRRLKEDGATRDIPIIFLAAYTDFDDWISGQRLGAVDLIAKPVLAADLLPRVKVHLALRTAKLAIESQAVALEQKTALLEAEVAMRHEVEAKLLRNIDSVESSRQMLIRALADKTRGRDSQRHPRPPAVGGGRSGLSCALGG